VLCTHIYELYNLLYSPLCYRLTTCTHDAPTRSPCRSRLYIREASEPKWPRPDLSLDPITVAGGESAATLSGILDCVHTIPRIMNPAANLSTRPDFGEHSACSYRAEWSEIGNGSLRMATGVGTPKRRKGSKTRDGDSVRPGVAEPDCEPVEG
jgi:hypothetical protein